MEIAGILFTLAMALIVPVVFLSYLFVSEKAAGGRRRGTQTARSLPVFWLIPAAVVLGFFLIYPMIDTIVLSFMNADSTRFAGGENYAHLFSDRAFLIALRNNLLWIVFFTLVTVTLGLILAVLTDRVRYEAVAKAVLFLPASISLVAASVIWKFMYAFRPAGESQIGLVNAALSVVPGFQPQAWLFDVPFNNAALMVVGVWIWTGFALVIFSASLKGISKDLVEAARIDGAREITVFFRIVLPLMSKTVTVVVTYFVITVLKIFDIVYVMTNGNLDTEVLANRMYKEMFNFRNFGRASVIAVMLLVAVVPVVVMNMRKFARGKAGK
ncbi:MAG: sugar ABC transporter permease [Spirochaetales bacterium]|nr:sugar ABC transporter permease [Spirochaetales bacterium]